MVFDTGKYEVCESGGVPKADAEAHGDADLTRRGGLRHDGGQHSNSDQDVNQPGRRRGESCDQVAQFKATPASPKDIKTDRIPSEAELRGEQGAEKVFEILSHFKPPTSKRGNISEESWSGSWRIRRMLATPYFISTPSSPAVPLNGFQQHSFDWSNSALERQAGHATIAGPAATLLKHSLKQTLPKSQLTEQASSIRKRLGRL